VHPPLADDLVDDRADWDELAAERDGARLELREIEELLNEVAESLDLSQRRLERPPFDRLDTVDEVLEHGLERTDGRPQLVRDVRDEVAAHAVDLGELGSHRVERARELADFVARGGRHAAAVVATRHRASCGDHFPQRKRHPMSEQLDECKRERGGRQAGHDRRETGVLAQRDDEHRHPDGGDNDDAELLLDRSEEVQRSHSSLVLSAYPIP
jgi:hypothetical protein